MNALWMIVASLLFVGMNICVKFAAASFSSAEIILCRGVIGAAFMWGFARIQGVSLYTNHLQMHGWRSLIGMVATGGAFYSIANLPLATATALNNTGSIWIAVFLVGGTILARKPEMGAAKGPIRAPLVVSVLAGFAGVLLLLRPELRPNELFAGCVGLLSSLLAALAYMQVVAFSKVGEPETRTVFYFALGCVVGGGLGTAITGPSVWSWSGAIWLLPIGVLAALGQWCLTRAYSDSATPTGTLVAANLQYSEVLFAAILGMLIFSDQNPIQAWFGIGMIVASGIAATVIRMRAIPGAPVDER